MLLIASQCCTTSGASGAPTRRPHPSRRGNRARRRIPPRRVRDGGHGARAAAGSLRARLETASRELRVSKQHRESFESRNSIKRASSLETASRGLRVSKQHQESFESRNSSERASSLETESCCFESRHSVASRRGNRAARPPKGPARHRACLTGKRTETSPRMRARTHGCVRACARAGGIARARSWRAAVREGGAAMELRFAPRRGYHAGVGQGQGVALDYVLL